MARILTLILGLAVLALVAYKVVYGRSLVTVDAEGGAPRPALEGASNAAQRIETEQDRRLGETLERAAPKE